MCLDALVVLRYLLYIADDVLLLPFRFSGSSSVIDVFFFSFYHWNCGTQNQYGVTEIGTEEIFNYMNHVIHCLK